MPAFCERQVNPKRAFAPGSFRWKQSGRARVLVGCPRRAWDGDHCSKGMRAYKVLTPAQGRCKVGQRRISK
jgi:hypothetical protein